MKQTRRQGRFEDETTTTKASLSFVSKVTHNTIKSERENTTEKERRRIAFSSRSRYGVGPVRLVRAHILLKRETRGTSRTTLFSLKPSSSIIDSR